MRRLLLLLVIVLHTGVASGSGARGPKTVEGVVNLNAATAEELQMLPGVGPSKVRNIVAYRAKHPFRTIDELARIKGIGRKMVRKLRAHLAVNGPTTARTVRLPPGSVVPPPPPPQPPPPRTPPSKSPQPKSSSTKTPAQPSHPAVVARGGAAGRRTPVARALARPAEPRPLQPANHCLPVP